MATRSRVFAFVFAAAGLAASCGGGVLTEPSAVTGGAWRLQSLETPAGLVAVSRSDNYTLDFREGGLLSAKADCNVCAGTYSIAGESLRIGPLACTRAFCGAASHDTAFLEILSTASRFGVRGAELSIESPKGVARLSR